MKKIFMFALILLSFPIIVNAKVKIDNTEYETLDEAVEKVKEGETIVLLDDVDVTDTTKYGTYYNWLFPDNVTLDLSGHSIITGRNNSGPNSVWLGNNLTIKNGSFISKYKPSGMDVYYEADYALFIGDEIETSNITLEDLTVSTGINIYNSLNVTLKNVTATGKTYYAVWLDEHATATIESGNYKTKGVAVVGVTKTEEFNSELTIKGGTFRGEKGKLSLSETNPKYLPPIIKGGTYDFDVTEFMAKDYVCTKNADKFTVALREFDRDVNIGEVKEDSKIKIESEKISQVLLDTLNSTKEIDVSNKDVNIVLNFEETKPEQSVVDSITKKIQDATITEFFDITIDIIDKSENKKIGNLTTLNDKIAFSIDISNTPKIQDGYIRTYYILRDHDGLIDIIRPTVSKDNKTLTFETDKFSIYALAYKDEKVVEVENPKTGDKIINHVLIAIAMMVSIIGCILFLNKNAYTK